MKLDDISFDEPVDAALVIVDGVHTLVWSRSAARADQPSRDTPPGASRPFQDLDRR